MKAMKIKFVLAYLVRFIVMILPGILSIVLGIGTEVFRVCYAKIDKALAWLSEVLPDPGPDPFAEERRLARRAIEAQHGKLQREQQAKPEVDVNADEEN